MRLSTASATVAFEQTQWLRCGIVLDDETRTLTIGRPEDPELIVWRISDIRLNGPRSHVARRDDGVLVTVVRDGGCGCR